MDRIVVRLDPAAGMDCDATGGGPSGRSPRLGLHSPGVVIEIGADEQRPLRPSDLRAAEALKRAAELYHGHVAAAVPRDETIDHAAANASVRTEDTVPRPRI